jgi:hypothetical protein
MIQSSHIVALSDVVSNPSTRLDTAKAMDKPITSSIFRDMVTFETRIVEPIIQEIPAII